MAVRSRTLGLRVRDRGGDCVARSWVRTLGFPRIISITDLQNVRSLAVMQRLGMTFDHETRIEDEGEVFDAVIYSITAGNWRERRTKRA
jgi:RimJ/RimL family protein N-acetyltransferase